MNIEDIQVGDLVRFRNWKDMEEEYGVDDDGNIPCPRIFARDMKYLCGCEATVYGITKDKRIELSGPKEWWLEQWKISAAMLESVDDEVSDALMESFSAVMLGDN